MNIFDVIPSNFFSLLSSPNRATYAGAIIEAFNVYEEGSILGIDKKIVVEVLTDYIEHESFDTDIENIETEDETREVSAKEKANYILRRMEECGWIDIDTTNDYVEILNFRDYAITFVEALLQINPQYDEYNQQGDEYKGYIYTIYSLLQNEEIVEYGILMEQVYRNTKLFIRELRKFDSRLKDYIKRLVDYTDIKDLMDALMQYKVELVDNTYRRLKTSDNVNKYRLFIVNKLEAFLDDPAIFEQIAQSYRPRYIEMDDCYKKAGRDLTEIIDVFNELDNMITQIDIKNKTYINSTIGKIEFLLKEDNNIAGKINMILKHVSEQNKIHRVDKAINLIQPIFQLKSFKSLEQESLYQPRNPYTKSVVDRLLDEKLDFFDLQDEFFKQFEGMYQEDVVLKYIDEHMVDGKLYASWMLDENPSIEDIIFVIYALIYAASDIEEKYIITKLDDVCHKGRYRFNEFTIERSVS